VVEDCRKECVQRTSLRLKAIEEKLRRDKASKSIEEKHRESVHKKVE
jgi:hypothetical protein